VENPDILEEHSCRSSKDPVRAKHFRCETITPHRREQRVWLQQSVLGPCESGMHVLSFEIGLRHDVGLLAASDMPESNKNNRFRDRYPPSQQPSQCTCEPGWSVSDGQIINNTQNQ
jgi:hypothetical protein